VLNNKKEEKFIMSRQKTHHTKQFKLDAINYCKEHPDLTQVECAKNLGIGVSTLAHWEAQFRDNDGDIPVIGVPAVTLLMKRRKSPTLSVSCVMHRMHLMC
jgi:transposase